MLKLVVLSLWTGEHPVVVRLFIPVAFPQRLDEPIEQAFLKSDPLDYVPWLFREGFLPNSGLRAWSVVRSALIIDVITLLDLSGNRTSAKSTAQHADEGEITFCLLGMIGLSERFLRLLPQVTGDNRGMATMEGLTIPQEIPLIDGVFENMLDRALG